MKKLAGYFVPFKESSLDGIFYFLNHIAKKKYFSAYSQPHESFTDQSYQPEYLTYRNLTKDQFPYYCTAENYKNITFEFSAPILITSYSLRNAYKVNAPHSYPTSWNLYGSNDNESWILIDSKEDQQFCDQTMCEETNILSFRVDIENYFSFIRIESAHNSEEKEYLILSAIEFFGEIKYYRICTQQQTLFSHHLICMLFIYLF